jgi:hypothetical protein
MKKVFVLFALILFGSALYAQDIITKTDGTDIQAKVTEVGDSQVTYKKYSNLEGPTYKINISDILMITYQNGEREMYNGNNDNKESSLPYGMMTYNSWSGKISVDGVTIENEMLNRYLTTEDLALFKVGKTMSTVGGIIGIVGAFPFGYGVGYLLGWAIGGGGTPATDTYANALNAAKIMAIVGGVTFGAGLAIGITGEGKVKKVVNSYNSRLSYTPTLHIGATPNGVGLAFVF